MEFSMINGGVAGNHSVSEINSYSVLKNIFLVKINQAQTSIEILGIPVLQTDSDTLNIQDITGEFTISSDGVINNTGGTNITGGILVITWNN